MGEVEIGKYFLTQGPFAVLFVWLLLYVMKTNKEREQQSAEREINYQKLLEKLTDKYDDIISDLRDIKSRLK